jgi:hypothetical protein
MWQQPAQFLLLSGFGECSGFFFIRNVRVNSVRVLVGKKSNFFIYIM